MTVVTIQVPDAIENKLRAQALVQGKEVARLALEILEKGLDEKLSTIGLQELSFEEWSDQFDSWVKSHPRIDVVIDYGREAIYEGRGE